LPTYDLHLKLSIPDTYRRQEETLLGFTRKRDILQVAIQKNLRETCVEIHIGGELRNRVEGKKKVDHRSSVEIVTEQLETRKLM
jgi:hypothetical protein